MPPQQPGSAASITLTLPQDWFGAGQVAEQNNDSPALCDQFVNRRLEVLSPSFRPVGLNPASVAKIVAEHQVELGLFRRHRRLPARWLGPIRPSTESSAQSGRTCRRRPIDAKFDEPEVVRIVVSLWLS